MLIHTYSAMVSVKQTSVLSIFIIIIIILRRGLATINVKSVFIYQTKKGCMQSYFITQKQFPIYKYVEKKNTINLQHFFRPVAPAVYFNSCCLGLCAARDPSVSAVSSHSASLTLTSLERRRASVRAVGDGLCLHSVTASETG